MDMTSKGRELREALEAHCDLTMAATIAETIANDCVLRINKLGVSAPTNMMAQVLVANALIGCASDWWAMTPDPTITPEVTREAIHSFTVELPADLTGISYDDREGRPG